MMMTKDEFIKKYSEVELKFARYYKYRFTFIGYTEDGLLISASFGGCSEDIYRCEVSYDEVLKVGKVLEEVWNFINAMTPAGETVFEWNDW